MARKQSIRSKALSPPPLKRKRVQLSCDHCRKNKRKCDRKFPCSQCKADPRLRCTFQRAKMTFANSRHGNAQEMQDDHNEEGNDVSPTVSTSHSKSNRSGVRSTSLSTPGTSFDDVLEMFPCTSQNEKSTEHPNCRPSTSKASLRQDVANVPEISAILRYLDHPGFLRRIFDIYIKEIDWIEELLENVRLGKILEKHPVSPRLTCSNEEWEVIHILVYAMISLTAQMCKSEFETALIHTNHEIDFIASRDQSPLSNDVQLCWSADKFAEISQNCMHHYLNQPELAKDSRIWPAEHFAAILLYRTFQKNTTCITEGHIIHEQLLMEIQRFRLAGFQYEPRTIEADFIIGHGLYPKEDKLLTYRVFWSFFGKDRFIGWSSNAGYVMAAQHCSICVRGEDGYHYTIEQMCQDEAGGDGNEGVRSDCSCHLDDDSPTLNKSQITKVRIASLLGRCYDDLAAIKKKKFQWPLDAQRLSNNLKERIDWLYSEIERHTERGEIKVRQLAILHLTLAYVRSMVAKTLLTRFINRMKGQNTDQSDAFATSWTLEKRLNEARMALLSQGRQSLSMLMTGSVSWIYGPKFVFIQVDQIMKSIEPWFDRSNDSLQLPIITASEQTFSHLIQCLYACMDARNSLVLLNRKNTLLEPKRYIRVICDALSDLFIKADLLDNECLPKFVEGLGNVDELIDLHAFKLMIEDKFQEKRMGLVRNRIDDAAPEVLPSMNNNMALVGESGVQAPPIGLSDFSQTEFNWDLDQIFAEFPSLVNLLSMPMDGQTGVQ